MIYKLTNNKLKTLFHETSILYLFIIIIYESLWIPISMLDEDETLGSVLKCIPIDLLICYVIALFNVLITFKIRTRIPSRDWTHKLAIISSIGLWVSNLFLCFPFSIIEFVLYRLILKDEVWDWQTIIFDSYFLTCIVSLIVNARFFILVSNAYQQSETNLVNMRLKMLESQLSPHFLFNSLSIGISFISSEPSKATKFFLCLSKSLRNVLTRSFHENITVSEEISDVQPYLTMLKLRYENSIDIKWEIPESVRQMCVLSGSILLAIENVIKHNCISSGNPLRIKITAHDDCLVIINNYRPLSIDMESFGLTSKILSHKYDLTKKKPTMILNRNNNTFESYIPIFKATDENTYY